MKQKLFILLLIIYNIGHSQTFDWGFNLGGHTDDISIDIKKVSDGVIHLSSEGLNKYDIDGNLIWNLDFFEDNINYTANLTSIDTDEHDNIYAILNFNVNETIRNIEFFKGTSLIKIDSEGDILWSRNLGNNSYTRNTTIIYKNDNIYVFGDFYEKIVINEEVEIESKQFWDCISYIYRTGTDIYMAKFNSIGVLLGTNTYGDEYDDFFISATIDNDENIYFTGSYGLRTCSVTHSQITKLDSNLNVLWSKKISVNENGSQIVYPTNLYYSNNNKLYLWGYNFGEVITNEFVIDGELNTSIAKANLLEFNPVNGDFSRLNHYPFRPYQGIYTVGGHWSFLTSTNGYMSDFNGDLLIFTSFTKKYNFNNGEFAPQENNQNLLLFKVNKKSFNSDYIIHFTGETAENHYSSQDNAAPILFDDNKLYLTGSFQSKPLNVLEEQILNNSGNNNLDILITKLDISDLTNNNDFLDDDNDSVINYLDLCPDTPTGILTDESGCSNIQLDTDQDGVINDFDECPNSAPNAIVEPSGCERFELPSDNFQIEIFDQICPDTNSGQIVITSNDLSHKYYITLNDEKNDEIFTANLEVNNLETGSYELCIFIEDIPEFKRCYEVIINEIPIINVSSKINYESNILELHLSGSNEYIIKHNNYTFSTSENKISIALDNEINIIEVASEKICQGIIEEIIDLKSQKIFPNPFNNLLNFKLNSEETETIVNIYSITGILISSKTFTPNDNTILDTSQILSGVYFVTISTNNSAQTFKVVKR